MVSCLNVAVSTILVLTLLSYKTSSYI